MKIFLDANVLVAVLNKEYPLYTYASRIISLAGFKNYRVYTSPTCLAIAYYFAEKKSKSPLAKKKIALLAKHLKIAPNSESGVYKTLSNSRINDFEDGLEYHAADEAGCTVIVTEDTGDFWFSDIEVLDCEGFIRKIANTKNS